MGLLSWLRPGTPRGEWILEGLRQNVEIRWDEWGVPHISAHSIRDAVFAQGVAHARDRFWQMEMNRRIGSGRLSEMLGQRTVAADRFLRRIGLRRMAEREVAAAHPQELELLEGYAAGVNAWKRHAGWRRPLELLLVGVRPEPWTPVDSLSWVKMMAFDLGSTWETELLRWRLLERLGPQGAAHFHLSYPADQPLMVPSGARSSLASLSELYLQARPWLGNGGASNAWAVSGERTASGKPLLASDPHLVMRLPSTWYEVHLTAPGLDVFGVSLPGVPLVVLGRNRQVAWGATNSFADCQDLYQEQFSRGAYRCGEGWREPERMAEVIRVRHNSPVLEEVVVTSHGPVLSGETRDGIGLALSWTGQTLEHTTANLLAVNQAGSVPELKQALHSWGTPSLNFIFADDQGEIGYLMAGRVPRRRQGNALVPMPGWTGEYDWDGFVPAEQLPSQLNPPTGYLASANNAVTDPGFHLAWDVMSGYRAQRIESQLAQGTGLEPADFARLQTDLTCLSGLEFARQCGSLELAPGDPLDREALECLLSWDGVADSNSPGAAIYEALLLETFQQAYVPYLGDELVQLLMGRPGSPLALVGPHGGRYVALLIEHLRNREGAVLGRAPGPDPQAWREILERSLARATATLRHLLGDRLSGWRWGRLHRLRLQHALGGLPILKWLLNGPIVEMGGDTDTVLQTAVIPHRPFGVDCWAPSWRMVADLSGPELVQTVLPSGQSGHWRNRHYLDQFGRWCLGRLKSVDWSDGGGGTRQRLIPPSV